MDDCLNILLVRSTFSKQYKHFYLLYLVVQLTLIKLILIVREININLSKYFIYIKLTINNIIYYTKGRISRRYVIQ